MVKQTHNNILLADPKTLTIQPCIDTMQVSIPTIHMTGEVKKNISTNPYMAVKGGEDDQKKHYKIQPNGNREIGYHMQKTLGDHIEKKQQIFRGVGIGQQIEVDLSLDRLDIAFDFDINFDANIKLMAMLYDLFSCDLSSKSRIAIFDYDAKKFKGFKCVSSDMNITAYDKKHKNPDHEYGSRFEFSMKRLSKFDYNFHLKKIIKRIKSIDSMIGVVNEGMSKDVIKMFKEKKNNDYNRLDLKTFVTATEAKMCLYNREVLKALYNEVGGKTSLKRWLCDLKKNSPSLVFYTLTDIRNIQSTMLRSLKTYMRPEIQKNATVDKFIFDDKQTSIDGYQKFTGWLN
jgi:hypothetical protein